MLTGNSPKATQTQGPESALNNLAHVHMHMCIHKQHNVCTEMLGVICQEVKNNKSFCFCCSDPNHMTPFELVISDSDENMIENDLLS